MTSHKVVLTAIALVPVLAMAFGLTVPGFVSDVATVTKGAGPWRSANSYDLPLRGTIVSRIHFLYDGERARQMHLLEHAASVALTGENWTSVSNDNYLGVTAHFIDNVWKLRSFGLEVKKKQARHTAENCAEDLIDVSNRWEISSKLTTLGTDGARNML